MNFIPKSNARLELDATERATLKIASELLNKLLIYFDTENDIDDGTIAIGDWSFTPDINNFSIYEFVELLDDLSNEKLSITRW